MSLPSHPLIELNLVAVLIEVFVQEDPLLARCTPTCGPCYETFPLACPACGATMRIIAFITETAPVHHIRRFAVLLCLDTRGRPSLVYPLDGKKVHWTFFCFRLALEHIGEPHQPPPIHPPRGPPDWRDADEQVFLDEDLDQDHYEIDKSSGQKICTTTGRPQGGAQGSAP